MLSSPGESRCIGRVVAKARGAGPVMSAPFVQDSVIQTGNLDPMSIMMIQMNR